jgi:hypothetical protein
VGVGARHRICRTQFTQSYLKGRQKNAWPSTLLYGCNPPIDTANQRKYNFIEENAEINKSLALIEVGHEVDTAAKYRVLRLSAKV